MPVQQGLDEEREKSMCIKLDLESLINKFAYSDSFRTDHKLLHYRLSVETL